MMPDISQWRLQKSYFYFDNLSIPDLAWEGLRRNTAYQRDYLRYLSNKEPEWLAIAMRQRWGLQFPARPSRNGLEKPVHWAIEADPAKVLVTAAPLLCPIIEPAPGLDPIAVRLDADALHVVHGQGIDAIQVALLDGAVEDVPLAAVVPLDAEAPGRIDALKRLWSSLHTPPPPADTRITPQRRKRFCRMMQAVDGRSNHATYREIAMVMYGARRVASEPWKTSALRDATIRLVRDGHAVADGGYRGLLRRNWRF